MYNFTKEDFENFSKANGGAMNQLQLIRLARENKELREELALNKSNGGATDSPTSQTQNILS